MNSIGFILVQWGLPVLRVWPIFTVFGLLCLGAFLWKQYHVAVKLIWGTLALLALLLLLRGLVLILIPYKDQRYEISYEDAKGYELLVDYNGGEVGVTFQDSEMFVLNTFDLSGVKPFRIHETSRINDGIEIAQTMIHVAGMEGYSLLTESDSRMKLIIPKKYTANQYYRLLSTHAKLDFTETTASKIAVNMQYSTATVLLPVSQKDVYIDLSGAFSPMTVQYDPRMNVVFDDNHNAMRSVELVNFVQERKQYYVHRGDPNMGTITVYARVSPMTLALLEQSGQ